MRDQPFAGAGGDAVVAGGASVGGQGAEAGANNAGSGGAATPSAITITVHASQDQHAISPAIYGVNPKGVACNDANAHFGLCRLGGHAWSTYNWENNASNAGIDNCSENDASLSASTAPGAAVTDVMTQAESVGATTLVQIPTLDYVAADEAPGTPSPGCSGDVRNSANYLSTRFKQNRPSKGAALSPTPDTTDAFVNQDEFVSFLATQAQATSAKVVFALDNQPDSWANDLPAVHPNKATYQEVVQRNVSYATMLRGIWPAAEVTGYVGYGYYGFETLQDAPDAAGKGLFLDYYLAQMQAASVAAGKRLIDYLDVHWYSEATGDGQRVLGDGVTPGLVAARLQAPRSLWDSSFVENSWITAVNGSAISLIPWLNQRIAAGYPSTKLAVSEWSFGGGGDISGALAAADTLGIFGREGVGLAAYASTSSSDQFTYAAFSAFRNYDGAGAAFGDTSVNATTNSVAVAPAYASVDSTDGDRMVVIILNRSDSALPTTVVVDHTATYVTAKVFSLVAGTPKLTVSPTITASSANTFALEMPPFSISVLVPQKQ